MRHTIKMYIRCFHDKERGSEPLEETDSTIVIETHKRIRGSLFNLQSSSQDNDHNKIK